MVEIELDGQKVEVAEGCMVMHAAEKAGTYIPHFCYKADASLRNARDARHGGPYQIRQGDQGPEVGDGISPDQSPAGLPHLRSRW